MGSFLAGSPSVLKQTPSIAEDAVFFGRVKLKRPFPNLN